MIHNFHIPVLGLGYSIDTPLKVARYGISSAVSIVDDDLCERMREYHSINNDIQFIPINKIEQDSRAKRITAYLNLLDNLVNLQFNQLKQQDFDGSSDIDRYFNLLPDGSQLKQGYELMQEFDEGISKSIFQSLLKDLMEVGAIDVNIMAKVDKMNYDADGNYLGEENTDALAALRGFAQSNLQSSLILSAGMNPKLYSYIETFKDFFPDESGKLIKKIILKVSDYRSASIQAKFLAKKGLWVSEFRVESGLNCGGHAFATEGLLLGPILEEFKQNRQMMLAELGEMYKVGLESKGIKISSIPNQRISAQGGIGTAKENDFLRNYYKLDSTGWGSPFLLVPEATNVDEETLQTLAEAKKGDYYLSASSPLGVLFNNFKKSTIEDQRSGRLLNQRPGSPCTKKYLCNNTEFTEQPICTASRQYQHLKIEHLKSLHLTEDDYIEQFNEVTAKVCLCEGLCASVYMKYGILGEKESNAVAICPGPNLAYFNKVYSLDEMIKHIYGGISLLTGISRPNLFVNELNLYVDYLRKEVTGYLQQINVKKGNRLLKFKEQMQQGINYYKELLPQITNEASSYKDEMYKQLTLAEIHLKAISSGLSFAV